MSNQRFTVNPFNELTLTVEDRTKLIELVDNMVLSKLREYQEHLNNDKKVDLTRWKKLARSGATTAYTERKLPDSDSQLPRTLLVGQLPGTLDENMFGLVNPTLESMRIKASYINDFSAAAVLAPIVEPTAEDPFRAIVIKWMEVDIPMASVGLVQNRDYVFVEGSGILHLKDGERVGYHVFHSVSFPETHKLPRRVRGDMSLCAFFRQEGSRTDCRGTGIMDPKGDVIRKMAVMGVISAVMASRKYSYCGQIKKLAWLLEQKHAESDERSAPLVMHGCVTCSKPLRNLTFGKSNTTCKLCFGALCGSCKVSKKLSFISPDLELTKRKVSFCVKCLVEASGVDALEAARHQFIYKQSDRSTTDSSSLAASEMTLSSDDSCS